MPRRRALERDEVRATRIATTLSEMLADLGITHRRLAEALGVSRYTVDSWTRAADPALPGEESLIHLCAFLEAQQAGLGVELATVAGAEWRPATGSPTSQPSALVLPQAPGRPNNLPVALTSFIGRERELAEVRRLLASTRLLTLTGAGGIGKTRLAIETARKVLAEYEDGAYFVALEALNDADLLPQAIATAVGAREQPGVPLSETLRQHLRARRVLLVVDNCEHLLDGCAALAAELLQACPHVRILATSREGLGVPGETLWRVPSLSLTAAGNEPVMAEHPPSAVSLPEALRLFVERARLVWPDFALTAENSSDVAELCERLDGMPLAIELAAANVRLLTVQQMVARLDDQFQLLASGARTARPRQQTLRAAIDWSHAQLSADEQTVFRRLAVFPGDFSLEAAEAVCAEESNRQPVLPLLGVLVRKSLVLAETSGPDARYRMLEPIRRYADEKLRQSDGADQVRRRHAEYFLEFSQQCAPVLRTGKRNVVMSTLGREDHNLRAALHWSIYGGDPSLALRMIWPLGWYWYFRGQLSEGREWIQLALAAATHGDPADRALALWGGGALAWIQGDYAASLAQLQESRAAWRTAVDRDDDGLAYTLIALGLLLGIHHHHEQAMEAMLEGLARFARVHNRWGMGLGYYWYGEILRFQGDIAGARSRLESSLQLFRALDDSWGISLALQGLGIASLRSDDLAQARAQFEEALSLRKAAADRWLVAQTMHSLGVVLRAQGDLEGAQHYFRASSDIYREVADRMGLAHALFNLADVLQPSDPKRAAVIYAECVNLFHDLGKPDWETRAQAALHAAEIPTG